MSRYDSINCPICKKPLENGEEIVVCPECGAPYHKSCIQAEGHCIFSELHEKGEAWAPEPKEPEQEESRYDKDAILRCPRCGTVNPAYGIFCQVCGNKLNDDPVPPPPPSGQGGANPQSPFGSAGFPPPGIPLNPYTTPFGGVAPDESIDGIPAKDLAIFVGRNSHYFLPQFKQLSQSGRKILNWGAFFFQGGYFLYRKMYGIAILLLLVTLLLQLPNTLLLLRSMEMASVTLTAMETAELQNLSTLSTVCTFVTLGVRFFCGLSANSFYKRHCLKKIREQKAIERTEDQYYAALSKKGSVAIKLITGLAIAYIAVNLIAMYLLILFGSF